MQLADMGKNHSSEAFFWCDNPLESAILSAVMEIRKIQERNITRVDT
jgi:hypothetical protein